METSVIIAGGGIGGLTLALTLHQIGVSCMVVESATEMRPLGVGINIQPNAVRELLDLGISVEKLESIGVPVQEWALVGLNGQDVYSEPRGTFAGYQWPQIAAHRGALHMLLYQTVVDRLGSDSVRLGAKVLGYSHEETGIRVDVLDKTKSSCALHAQLLIGADGIHSRVRATMYPDQPPIHWGGALLWRGTVRTKPLRTGSSFIGLGTHERRMVIYPISEPDEDGLALVNWIAEITVDDMGEGWQHDSWFRLMDIDSVVPHFKDFTFDWLDVPAMLRCADCVYENPMIDRDPIPTWVDGPVALLGDAAHAMYPTGSNGASQAIVDARILGAAMVNYGVTQTALQAYDARLCGPISELILRNRGAGPFGLLDMLDERCGGVFDNIDDVIPLTEREAFMANYKSAAGFEKAALNASPPIIAAGDHVGQAIGC